LLVLVVALVVAGAPVVCFLAYLALCAFVVVRCGGTAGLRDVAIAVRAFRGVIKR